MPPRKTMDAPTGGVAANDLDLAHDASARREPPEASVEGIGGPLDRTKEHMEGTARSYAGAAKRWAGDRMDEQRDRLDALSERGRRYVGDVADRGSAHLARRRSAVESFVAENPALVGVVGLAAGLLVGALLPRTAREDRVLGPYADDARDQGLRYARDSMHSGRAYVEAAMDQAHDAMNTTPDEAGAAGAAGVRSGPSGRYQNH